MEVVKRKLIGNEVTTSVQDEDSKEIDHISDVKGGEELEGFTGREKRSSGILNWLSQGQSFTELNVLRAKA